MKALEVIKRIIGSITFLAIVYLKVTGGDVDIFWLIIPAILMGLSLEDLIKFTEAWRRR